MIKTFGGKTPQVAQSAFVSEAAYVIGDVEIGEGSSIWPGVVIRGDIASIKIGKMVNVQDNSVLHADTPLVIGDNVLIGHSAVIHCERIGNNVIVGINATLLDFTQIGDFCIIGANAMVGERMRIPDRSLVLGVPARVKKELSAEQIKMVERACEHYALLAQEYKKQGF
ncbi:MAG: gamma carbonic anhydrase family protein [Dehalococcoidia bacterium]|nr:gamma carbonic anhydrase family protein [Dehalococcoidia bacterium]